MFKLRKGGRKGSVQELKECSGVKGVKELRRMSCCLKNYAKKTIVLTPLTP